eukprot:scaffold1227_cov256-Pinguiococcus_pyrenoidosus.AAC.5
MARKRSADFARRQDTAIRLAFRIGEELRTLGIEVVVFDMDHTMSRHHCGEGLDRDDLDKYIGGVSEDFVVFAPFLAAEGFKLAVGRPSRLRSDVHCVFWGVLGMVYRCNGLRVLHNCATATPAFPLCLARWPLDRIQTSTILTARAQKPTFWARILRQRSSRRTAETFVLRGPARPELRSALTCEAHSGYDSRRHGSDPEEKGKRYHMRKIREFYDTSFEKMLLIDDSPRSLENEDGWHGALVQDPSVGFRLQDLEDFLTDALANEEPS